MVRKAPGGPGQYLKFPIEHGPIESVEWEIPFHSRHRLHKSPWQGLLSCLRFSGLAGSHTYTPGSSALQAFGLQNWPLPLSGTEVRQATSGGEGGAAYSSWLGNLKGRRVGNM